MAKKPKPERPKKGKPHASKALVLRRVEEVLRLRLDIAAFHDVCTFVREKEAEEGSAWHLAPGQEPLSESQVRRYVIRADALAAEQFAGERPALVALHAARRENLAAKANLAGDYRTALACLRDLAELQGLYAGAKQVITGPNDGPIQARVTHGIADDLAPYADALRDLVAGRLGAGGGGLPEGGPAQPVGAADPDPAAGPLPPLPGP